MNWKVLSISMPFVMLVLVVAASLMPAYLNLHKRRTVRVVKPAESDGVGQQIREQGTELVSSVATNNSCEELTNVFSNLLAGLDELGVELNVNLRGYVANG